MENSPQTEALARSRLDVILLLTLAMVKERLAGKGQSMSWQSEMYMKIRCHYDDHDRMLNGYPDYCLWYGQSREAETNLVIAEAKSKSNADSGETQLLTYMGKH
jgi:hypothetical protein